AEDHPQRGNVVGDHDPVEIDVHQRLHHFAHVSVAVVDQGLSEVGERRAHVAEMDLEQLLHAAEVFNHADHVLAGHTAALHPTSTTQTHADVRAVGDLECSLVALKIREDAARDASQHRLRRVVRVYADADPGFLGHRNYLHDEVRVVFPDLFLREH